MTGISNDGRNLSLGDLRIFGVDPGKTTGLLMLNQGDVVALAGSPIDVCVAIRAVLREITPPEYTAIACEKFVITKNTSRKTPQHDALEVTGVLRHIAHEHRVHFIQQNMSDSKKIGNKKLLASIGWTPTGRNARHIRDAMAQVIMCLAANHPIALEELLNRGIV